MVSERRISADNRRRSRQLNCDFTTKYSAAITIKLYQQFRGESERLIVRLPR